jgi:soluble cytochrome b562
VDVVDMISGRTKLSTLLRLQAKLDELLAERDKGEVKKVKDALTNVQKLRAELDAAEKLIT